MPIAESNKFVYQAIASVKVLNPAISQGEGVSLPYEESPVVKDLGNGLSVVYLVDNGDSFTYMQNRHLRETGVGLDGLHNIGVTNLAEYSNGKARMKQYGDVYVAFLDNNFDASLILRDDLWDDELAFLAPNGFIAALPARTTLAVCDAKSSTGIASLKAIVKEAFTENSPLLLTPQLYQRVGGRWIIYNH